ncbi:MAG: hypothetical protein ACE5F9_12395 [Phycisphaerae bacterium]
MDPTPVDVNQFRDIFVQFVFDFFQSILDTVLAAVPALLQTLFSLIQQTPTP